MLLWLALACAPPAATPTAPPAPPPAPAPSRADAVNAKLPPGVALRFEERKVVDPTEQLDAVGAVPVGWTPTDGFPGWFKPPKEANLGWMTSYKIQSDCAGACTPKDWKAVIDRQMLDRVPDAMLRKDEPLADGGRIRWGADASSGAVYAAWSREGDARFYACTAMLDGAEAVKLLDAFVEACRATKLGG